MLSKIVNRPVAPDDVPLISALHDRVFGPGRFSRTAYRVREQLAGTARDCSPYCRLAMDGGEIVAALRMTEITIGGTAGAMLLGPLVVAPEYAGQGYGRALVGEAVEAAGKGGKSLVVLIGDEPYYGRFGFKPVPAGKITLPGPVDPQRILAAELTDGALTAYTGLVAAAR